MPQSGGAGGNAAVRNGKWYNAALASLPLPGQDAKF